MNQQIIITYVNPAYTSKICSVCGYVAENNRKKEEFKCKCCGSKKHADVNGACNIRDRSSISEINIYSYKNKVLQVVVDKFITGLERFSNSFNSRAIFLVRKNPYFEKVVFNEVKNPVFRNEHISI